MANISNLEKRKKKKQTHVVLIWTMFDAYARTHSRERPNANSVFCACKTRLGRLFLHLSRTIVLLLFILRCVVEFCLFCVCVFSLIRCFSVSSHHQARQFLMTLLILILNCFVYFFVSVFQLYTDDIRLV